MCHLFFYHCLMIENSFIADHHNQGLKGTELLQEQAYVDAEVVKINGMEFLLMAMGPSKLPQSRHTCPNKPSDLLCLANQPRMKVSPKGMCLFMG